MIVTDKRPWTCYAIWLCENYHQARLAVRAGSDSHPEHLATRQGDCDDRELARPMLALTKVYIHLIYIYYRNKNNVIIVYT